MLRSVTLSLAMSVLAVACALVEPPPPPGTRSFQIEVRNATTNTVELMVATPAGVLEGGAQPAALPAGPSTSKVSLYVPITGAWGLTVNGAEMITVDRPHDLLGRGCTVTIELDADGGYGVGC